MRLPELEKSDSEVNEIKKNLLKTWEDIKSVFYYEGFRYISEITCFKIIRYYNNDLLANRFWIKKTRAFIIRKYIWLIAILDVKAYMKGCNIYLTLKTVYHKSYKNLRSLPILIYCWRDLLIDFRIEFQHLVNWKSNSYDSILVIVNCLTKIVYNKQIKTNINITRLAKIIMDVVLRYYDLLKFILSN